MCVWYWVGMAKQGRREGAEEGGGTANKHNNKDKVPREQGDVLGHDKAPRRDFRL